MTDTDIWRDAFERLHARVTRVCNFDASESAPPEDERWALELDQLAQAADALAESAETATRRPRKFDVAKLLHQGGTVTLAYDGGQDEQRDETGAVVDEGYPAFYYADAADRDGQLLAGGCSTTTLADALDHLAAASTASGEYAIG